jgi:hypothetical protein
VVVTIFIYFIFCLPTFILGSWWIARVTNKITTEFIKREKEKRWKRKTISTINIYRHKKNFNWYFEVRLLGLSYSIFIYTYSFIIYFDCSFLFFFSPPRSLIWCTGFSAEQTHTFITTYDVVPKLIFTIDQYNNQLEEEEKKNKKEKEYVRFFIRLLLFLFRRIDFVFFLFVCVFLRGVLFLIHICHKSFCFYLCVF